MSLALVQPPPDRDAAFARLVPVVTRWCHRLGAGRIDAEAAASDVLVVVLRRWDEISHDRPVEAWAWGVTLRVVQRHRRQGWWRRWVQGGEVAASPAPRGADPDARDTARAVLAVLDRLREEHREVLVLVDMEERPGPQVALLLGVPEGTVRSRLRAARVAFREVAEGMGLDLMNLLEDSADA